MQLAKKLLLNLSPNSPKTILVTYLDKALEAVKEVMDKVKVLGLGQEADQILVVVWVMEKEGRS